MAFAALMVHFDGTPASQGRLAVAVDLAIRFEAALIGIAGRSYLPSFLGNGDAGQRNTDEQREMNQFLAELEKKFRIAAKNVRHVEWRGVPAEVTNLIVREARAADLLIIGDGRRPDAGFYGIDVGTAVTRAGCPVLVVPEEIRSFEGQRAVVGWKDTREARRAIRDAIPFLKQAQKVMLVEICEHGTEAQSEQRLNQLKDYLFAHQITVTEKVYLHTDRPIGSELLRYANDENADLMVAGAYGHSRLGEWMFGGVTRSLLKESPICILFSH